MSEVFFNGPAGRIEGNFVQSEDKYAPTILLLHPHPLYGGSMNNKVVHAMYRTFVSRKLSVLRINFRGVGRSQGEYDNGIGELTDAATALDWLQSHYPLSTEYWIGGFSFGAWIAMQMIMRRPEITRFVSVAPPVNKYDFSFLSPCPIPGVVLQGNIDSIVSEESVIDLIDKLQKQRQLKVEYVSINGADHFFRNKTDEFSEALGAYLDSVLK